MQDKIEQDLKSALLSGDKAQAEALRTIKSAIQNETISAGARDSGLSDERIQAVLAREAKKRAEAAGLYQKAGEKERADKELAEKALIERYLPEQMDEPQVAKVVEEEIAKVPDASIQNMGQIIGAVRGRTAGQADGALIAKLVKERLQ